MFVLPSVFSQPAVTKGRFPLVTVELTLARADPAGRGRPGDPQGPATGREAPCSWGTKASTATTVMGTASRRVTRELTPATASSRHPFLWGLLPRPSSPRSPMETELGPGQGGFHTSGVGPPSPQRPIHLAGTFRTPLTLLPVYPELG